jgi:hypothetical protein
MVFSINPYPANVENMVSYNNASTWRMGFKLAFKGLSDQGGILKPQCMVCGVNKKIKL